MQQLNKHQLADDPHYQQLMPSAKMSKSQGSQYAPAITDEKIMVKCHYEKRPRGKGKVRDFPGPFHEPYPRLLMLKTWCLIFLWLFVLMLLPWQPPILNNKPHPHIKKGYTVINLSYRPPLPNETYYFVLFCRWVIAVFFLALCLTEYNISNGH